MSSPLDHTSLARRASSSASPHLMTPNGTPPNFPPTFSEAKLSNLLSNFDHGTHSFDRDERESPEERRLSFGDALGARRRSSFLSSLSLTRPGFGFSSSPSSGSSTPVQTPTTAGHPKEHFIPGLSMTKHTNNTAIHDEPEPISRPKSTPASPAYQINKGAKPPAEMSRSNTTPQGFGAMLGKKGKLAMAQQHQVVEERHFDPSKEPRLLGLL